MFKTKKSEIAVLQPILFCVYWSFPIVSIFKHERVTAIPANPYFLPKMAEHDVTHGQPVIAAKFSFGQHVRAELMRKAVPKVS